ncbi:MAG TPA: DUF748 domain-containing protein [Syntrophorhabdaceae bacterium]|nr:DUF748 domain-containing protein [Syntrophorhabdaceae bacterium]
MVAVSKNKKKMLLILLPIIAVLLLSGFLLVRYANLIIKTQLEKKLGKAFSVDRIELTLGHVQAFGVKLRDVSGREIVRIEKLSLRANIWGILKKQYVISSISLEKPYFMIEKDRNGKITAPPLPVGSDSKGDKTRHNPKEPGTPIEVKKLVIKDGALDYVDRKTSTPVSIRLRSIQFNIDNVHVPVADAVSTYKFDCTAEGQASNGKIKSEGKVNTGRKDANYTMRIQSFDLTSVKPYVQKHSSANLSHGLLDVDVRGSMLSSRIDASGNATLKNLRFAGGGNQFLGVPLTLVIALLEKNNNEIPVAFKVKGNINSPTFSLQEEFMASMAIALADKLGFSIQSLGEALLGTKERDRKSGVDILELGKGLQNIFGR